MDLLGSRRATALLAASLVMGCGSSSQSNENASTACDTELEFVFGLIPPQQLDFIEANPR